jgi:hypothetical protein
MHTFESYTQHANIYTLVKAKGDQKAGHKYKSRKPDGKGAWLYDYGDGKGFRGKKDGGDKIKDVHIYDEARDPGNKQQRDGRGVRQENKAKAKKEGGSKTVKEHLSDDTPPEADDLPKSVVERIEKYKLDVHGENLERVIDVAQRLEAGIDKAADICKAQPAVCAGNMGIPRADMPQIMDESVKGLLAAVDKENKPDEKSRAKGRAAVDAGADPNSDAVPFQMMLDHLKSQGVGMSAPTATPVGALKATQRDIQEDKATFFAERQMLGTWPNGKPADVSKDPIVISNDGHILDGHHRWAALAMLGPDMTMNAIKVDLPMHELLGRSFDTPGAGVFRMDMQNKVIEGGKPDYKKYKAEADASLKGAGQKKEDKKVASLKAPGFNQLWKANRRAG